MDKIDKAIKERLNVDDMQITKKANEKINNTVNGLNNSFNYMKIASLILITTISLFLIGVSDPIYAKKLKDVGNSFKNIGVNENYDKYATEINITKGSNGTKLTILSVLYDGYDMNITYKVDGKFTDVDDISILNNIKIFFEGEEIKNDGGFAFGEIGEDGDFYGITTITLGDSKISSLEKFNIDMEIWGIGSKIEGNWKYEVAIDNSEVINEINVTRINKRLGNIKIKSIEVTPISIYVDYSVKWGKNSEEIIIRDLEGNDINSIGKSENGMFFKKWGKAKYDNYHKKLEGVEIQVGNEKIKVKLNKM